MRFTFSTSVRGGAGGTGVPAVLAKSGSYSGRCKARNGSHAPVADTRARVLHRDQWTCQECGAPASHVDHIRPGLLGGADNEPLQGLCRACHPAKGSS